jgi:hypothetical protein
VPICRHENTKQPQSPLDGHVGAAQQIVFGYCDGLQAAVLGAPASGPEMVLQ